MSGNEGGGGESLSLYSYVEGQKKAAEDIQAQREAGKR